MQKQIMEETAIFGGVTHHASCVGGGQAECACKPVMPEVGNI